MKTNFALLRLLKEKRLRQAELTHLAMISNESRLSRIVNGFIQPKPEELKRMAKVLGVSIEKLGFKKTEAEDV
jgi:transcriptional regulator with XRE-family HTH domain